MLSANIDVFFNNRFKCPVRCVLPRELDMAITGKRAPYLTKYKVWEMYEGSYLSGMYY